MSTNGTKTRFEYLDVISGLMLIHMILIHTMQWGGLWGKTSYNYVSQALFFFMPWFYFKAGLFIKHRDNVGECVKKDFMRLIVPFVVFTAIGTLFDYINEFLTTDREWWKILGSPVKQVIIGGSASGNLALWFLLSLFWTRFAFRLIPEKAALYVVLVAAVGGAALSYLDIRLPLSLSTVFPGFVFLMLGYYSSPYIIGGKLIKLNGGGYKTAIVIIYIIITIWLHPGCDMRTNHTGSNYMVWLVGAWIGCLSMVVLFNSVLGRISLLAYIGRNSMLFYVIHWLPLFVSQKIIIQICPSIEPIQLTVTLMVIVALTLLAAARCRKYIPSWCIGEG